MELQFENETENSEAVFADIGILRAVRYSIFFSVFVINYNLIK